MVFLVGLGNFRVQLDGDRDIESRTTSPEAQAASPGKNINSGQPRGARHMGGDIVYVGRATPVEEGAHGKQRQPGARGAVRGARAAFLRAPRSDARPQLPRQRGHGPRTAAAEV